MLKKIFGANWKTSVTGFLEAVLIGTIEVAMTGTLTWKGLGLGALTTIRGLLQKDYDTTGTGSGASKAPNIDNAPIGANPN